VWVEPNGSEPRRPERIAAAGAGVRSPAVSSTGRLAFGAGIHDTDIWQVDLTKGHATATDHIKVVSSTRLDHTVKFSPDGKRLAFASDRSGSHEIWVSDRDGANAMQLTSFDGPYTAEPFWSPDGKQISFNSQLGGSWAIYAVPAQGGAIKRLTDARFRAQGGSWTPDGRWIYCHIDGQLWRVPAEGGAPVQITRNGGAIPAQYLDGRIYYAKQEMPVTSVWTVPAEGGEERQVLPSMFSHNMIVRKDGIYFVPGPEKPAIWFYRFSDRRSSILATLRHPTAFGMDVSEDGRVALVPEYTDTDRDDIMMIENFR
jgi:Tol biopolymer transport system component